MRLAVVLAALLLVAAPATAAPQATSTGIVDIETVLSYQGGSAAGTGMVIGPGRILTNNHVIRGATAISVVDVNTGRKYAATVAGYSVSSDVAVLKITGGSSLKTVTLGHSTTASVGDNVTAVGNAGGTGGSPTISTGQITGLKKSIVATDEQGDAQRLTGLLEIDAEIEPGDSGGAVLDRSGKVIGMITAGSSTFRFSGAARHGYAVGIDKAIAIAKQIATGKSSATVHVGKTAFLGVSLSDAATSGVLISRTVPGSAADNVGLVAGDVLTHLNGKSVDSPTSVQKIVLALKPGRSVTIRWVDQTGAAKTGRVTPAVGPAQ